MPALLFLILLTSFFSHSETIIYEPNLDNKTIFSSYIKANLDNHVVATGSPSEFSGHITTHSKNINGRKNTFDFTMLDASKLKTGGLFIDLSHLTKSDFKFIDLNQPISFDINLSDQLNNPYFEDKTKVNKDILPVVIDGFNAHRLYIQSNRDLSISFVNSKIDRLIIAIPEHVDIHGFVPDKELLLIKNGWFYKGGKYPY